MSRRKRNKIEEALYHLAKHETECKLCPRECGVDRKSDEKGYCQTTNQAFLSHAVLHFGEEPVLSGMHNCARETGKSKVPRSGSGALFFSGCNLKCRFCQNYQISWFNQGEKLSSDELAAQMIGLQKKGALNINLVSPTHILIPILRALQKAYDQGLHIPLVYNSNGYEKAEIIQYLDEIVDVYLPDCKYFSSQLSQTLSQAPDYFLFARASIQEMYRQRPRFKCDDHDRAQKGLIIRHLVLPGQNKDSINILKWLSQNCRDGTALSLMSQYIPCYKAPHSLQRSLEGEEYNKVVEKAIDCGFETVFIQPEPFTSGENRIPDFNRKNPFDWS
ncbi:MAG: radical SAM protein [Candidatus Aminicenantes bacterium]|nr:MAG: radical SAM protein [Candidatus Aminicenantes bacterium]